MTYETLPPCGMGAIRYISVRECGTHVLVHTAEGVGKEEAQRRADEWIETRTQKEKPR